MQKAALSFTMSLVQDNHPEDTKTDNHHEIQLLWMHKLEIRLFSLIPI